MKAFSIAFITGDDQTVTVSMMFNSDSFDYFKTKNFQALQLPYGETERMSMRREPKPPPQHRWK